VAFAVGGASYIEFEPIVAMIFFTFLSSSYMVRGISVLGVKYKNILCQPKRYLLFALGNALLYMSLGYSIFYVVRTIYTPTYIPIHHLPENYEYYPWLYLAYMDATLYCFAFLVYLASIIDVVKAKELLIDNPESSFLRGYNYFDGGFKKILNIFIFFGVMIGVMVFMGPLFYVVDVIRGRENPPMPLGDFVPLFLKVYIVATFPIGLILLVYSVVKILRRRYYTYLSNCGKRFD